MRALPRRLNLANDSTASGSAQSSDAEASTPDAGSTPGVASPEALVSPRPAKNAGTMRVAEDNEEADDNEGAVWNLVNDPKDNHKLLTGNVGETVAKRCHRLDMPLAARRVMAAVLPADGDACVQLSLGHMQRMKGLHKVLDASTTRPPTNLQRAAKTKAAAPVQKKTTTARPAAFQAARR